MFGLTPGSHRPIIMSHADDYTCATVMEIFTIQRVIFRRVGESGIKAKPAAAGATSLFERVHLGTVACDFETSGRERIVPRFRVSSFFRFATQYATPIAAAA